MSPINNELYFDYNTALNNNLINKSKHNITFFKKAHKRHDIFSQEIIKHNSSCNLNDIINGSKSFILSHNGDLVESSYINIDFGNTFYSETGIYNYSEIKEYCKLLFNSIYITIKIGGFEYLNNNIVKVNPNLFNDARYVSWDTKSMQIYLNNYIRDFCKVIVLQYHEIEVKLTIIKFNNNNTYNSFINYKIANCDNTISEFYKKINSNTILISLFNNYIYLDTDERRKFAKSEEHKLFPYTIYDYKLLNINYYRPFSTQYTQEFKPSDKLIYILMSFTDNLKVYNTKTVDFIGNINIKINGNSISNGSISSSIFKTQYLQFLENTKHNKSDTVYDFINENNNVMALSFTNDTEYNNYSGALILSDNKNISTIHLSIELNGYITNNVNMDCDNIGNDNNVNMDSNNMNTINYDNNINFNVLVCIENYIRYAHGMAILLYSN